MFGVAEGDEVRLGGFDVFYPEVQVARTRDLYHVVDTPHANWWALGRLGIESCQYPLEFQTCAEIIHL